jgi:hypothetical protein
MRPIAQTFILVGYLACIAMGLGYAWLIARKPRERKALFVVAWLTITIALVAAFRVWGEAHVMNQYARMTVDNQLAKRPGLRAMSQQHPELRAGLEKMALAVLQGHDTTDDVFIAAANEYGQAMEGYESAYLAIAADQPLMSYAGALAAMLAHINDRSGYVCGAFLNGDLGPIIRTMSNGRVDLNVFMDARDAAILSAIERPHALLPAGRAGELDAKLMEFLERRYGPLQAKVLLNAIDAPAPADDPELCTATVVSIEYALALPPPDREDMVRMIFQAGATELPDEPAHSDASAPLQL